MPNPISTFRGYFRFKAGEKPTEGNLNFGLVDKLDIDINGLLTSVGTLSTAVGNTSLLLGTTLVDRINDISDSSGNLTKSSPEFQLIQSGSAVLKTSNTQFKILGEDDSAKFRVNGRVKITMASSAKIIAVASGVAFDSTNTVVDLNPDYSTITEASITEVYGSHELDSFPVVNGAVDILKASITADRLAPGVGASSAFTSDVSITKANPALQLVATTGTPIVDLYAQTATVANRRRAQLLIGTDNILRVNRITDSGSLVDTILTSSLVTGVFDFAQGITMGALGSPINSAGSPAQTIASDVAFAKLPTYTGVPAPSSATQLIPKSYADLKMPITGGTFTGSVTLVGDPVSALQPGTKQYIDAKLPKVLVADAITVATTTSAEAVLKGFTLAANFFNTNGGGVHGMAYGRMPLSNTHIRQVRLYLGGTKVTDIGVDFGTSAQWNWVLHFTIQRTGANAQRVFGWLEMSNDPVQNFMVQVAPPNGVSVTGAKSVSVKQIVSSSLTESGTLALEVRGITNINTAGDVACDGWFVWAM